MPDTTPDTTYQQTLQTTPGTLVGGQINIPAAQPGRTQSVSIRLDGANYVVSHYEQGGNTALSGATSYTVTPQQLADRPLNIAGAAEINLAAAPGARVSINHTGSGQLIFRGVREGQVQLTNPNEQDNAALQTAVARGQGQGLAGRQGVAFDPGLARQNFTNVQSFLTAVNPAQNPELARRFMAAEHAFHVNVATGGQNPQARQLFSQAMRDFVQNAPEGVRNAMHQMLTFQAQNGFIGGQNALDTFNAAMGQAQGIVQGQQQAARTGCSSCRSAAAAEAGSIPARTTPAPPAPPAPPLASDARDGTTSPPAPPAPPASTRTERGERINRDGTVTVVGAEPASPPAPPAAPAQAERGERMNRDGTVTVVGAEPASPSAPSMASFGMTTTGIAIAAVGAALPPGMAMLATQMGTNLIARGTSSNVVSAPSGAPGGGPAIGAGAPVRTGTLDLP